METQHTVTARKRHRCGDRYGPGCSGWIEPGEKYLRAVAFPGSDVNADGPGPYVLRACTCCAHGLDSPSAPRMRRRRR